MGPAALTSPAGSEPTMTSTTEMIDTARSIEDWMMECESDPDAALTAHAIIRCTRELRAEMAAWFAAVSVFDVCRAEYAEMRAMASAMRAVEQWAAALIG